MVGEVAAVQPVLPVVGRPGHAVKGLVDVLGRGVLRPRQRAEHDLALLHQVPGGRPRPLEAEHQVGRERELHTAVGAGGAALVVVVAGIAPGRGIPPVVELRLAVEQQLGLTVDATHRAQQHVVGVVVGGGAAVGVGTVVLVVPVADQQHVADDHPALPGAPAGLQDHRPRQVAPGGRHRHPVGTQAKRAGVAVEHRPEDRRRIHPRQAHPLHRAAGSHQRDRLTVRQEGVLGDRRKRALAQPSGRVRARDRGDGPRRGGRVVVRHGAGAPVGRGRVRSG
jgi:hypothetical protein